MRPPRLATIIANFFGLIDVPVGFHHMGLHAGGRLTDEEKTFIQEMERPKVFLIARIWVGVYATTAAACFALGSILPAMFIGLPRLYGAWHHVLTGLTQHAGLAEDTLDHRLNSRTVYMNPISRFVYWNMNYHLDRGGRLVGVSGVGPAALGREVRIGQIMIERGLSPAPATLANAGTQLKALLR